MTEPMSQKFVTAFLTSCFEQGLSKEAAAELLQWESIDRECKARPAFAEGFNKVAAQAPGQLRPLLFTGAAELEKEAGKEQILKPLSSAARNLWGAVKDVGTVGKNVASRGGRQVGSSMWGPKGLIKQYPRSTFLGGAGIAAGSALGINALMNRDAGLYGIGEDPYLSPGGYDPSVAASAFDGAMGQYKPSIFKHNKELDEAREQMGVLDKAIENNEAGGNAWQERQELQRKLQHLERSRERYDQNLSAQELRSQELVERISQRQSDLEGAKTSWLSAPKRLWLRATGRNPEDYYNNKLSDLQSSSAHAGLTGRTAAERLRLLRGGVLSQRELGGVPSSADMQEQFFAPYAR